MSTYRLKNLLSPHSVALVGASPRHGSVGRAILNNIRKARFKGEFGLVNPRYHEIDGVVAVGSIGKLAFAPELVVITAPARTIADLIKRLKQLRDVVHTNFDQVFRDFRRRLVIRYHWLLPCIDRIRRV